MRANDFNPWLESAVAEVLEAMCFVSTAGDSAEEEAHHQPEWVCGKLDFQGSPSGTFGLAVPPVTALTIAANFLGEDEDSLSYPQTIEVICELTNMVCGTLLAHLEPRRTFSLSAPRSATTPGLAPSPADRISRTFTLDEGFLYTWLEIRDRP